MKFFSLLLRAQIALVALVSCIQALEEKPMVVIIPSFNNSAWYKQNLDSVFMQDYHNFRVVYVDDCSDDQTGQLVEEYIALHGQQERCTLIQNSSRVGALMNLYRVIHACKDEEIIVTLDGDDWLKHERVLASINTAYAHDNVWLTYGQYEQFPTGKTGMCRPYPPLVVSKSLYREYDWISSHLRTFYAGLFKRIKVQDLLYAGTLFPVTWDLAMMFPMLEMAAGKIKCIQDVLYVYNYQTPHNDAKLRAVEQVHCEHIIRAKQKYSSIKNLNNPAYCQIESIDVIVLTNGVPAQLEGFALCRGVGQVYYVDVTTDAHCALLSVLEQISAPCVFVLSAPARFGSAIDFGEYATVLLQTQAHCFSFVLSACYEDAHVKPACAPITQTIRAWRLATAAHAWHCPFSCDAVLYTTATLRKAVAAVPIADCQQFLSALNHCPTDIDAIGLCLEKSLVSIL